MSKQTEAYRHVGVYNAHNFAGHGNVFITYRAADHGRAGHSAAWQCCKPGENTDPDFHWMNHGNKTVMLFGRGTTNEVRQFALDEIMAWASKKYGIKKWAKTPYGSWMDEAFVKRRIKELDQAVQKGAGHGS